MSLLYRPWSYGDECISKAGYRLAILFMSAFLVEHTQNLLDGLTSSSLAFEAVPRSVSLECLLCSSRHDMVLLSFVN